MTPSQLPHLHPTASRLVVHLRPGQQQTPSGLIIPPQFQQITQYGDVLAIGPDVTDVHVGDLVLVGIHAGTTLCELTNTPVILVDLKDLQAVLEPGSDPTTL